MARWWPASPWRARRVGDEVVLLPHNLTGRVRRIEVYGQGSETVMAGQCAAINVGHWDHRLIRRGNTLTLPGYFAPEHWFVCSARLLPREKLTLKTGAEVRFHTGTSDVAAMFYPLRGNQMEGGAAGLIQLRAKTPVVAGPGDHFLLRTLSPVRTIGGGVIVEAVQQRFKGSRPGVCEDLQERAKSVGDECRFVEYCVRRAELLAVDELSLAVRTKVPAGRLREVLSNLVGSGAVLALAGRFYIHRDTAAEAQQRMLGGVGEFHRQSPESPGMPVEQLRKLTLFGKAVFDGLVARLASEGRLVEKNGRLALPEHRSTFQDEDARLLEAVEALFLRSDLLRPARRRSGCTRALLPKKSSGFSTSFASTNA